MNTDTRKSYQDVQEMVLVSEEMGEEAAIFPASTPGCWGWPHCVGVFCERLSLKGQVNP